MHRGGRAALRCSPPAAVAGRHRGLRSAETPGAGPAEPLGSNRVSAEQPRARRRRGAARTASSPGRGSGNTVGGPPGGRRTTRKQEAKERALGSRRRGGIEFGASPPPPQPPSNPPPPLLERPQPILRSDFRFLRFRVAPIPLLRPDSAPHSESARLHPLFIGSWSWLPAPLPPPPSSCRPTPAAPRADAAPSHLSGRRAAVGPGEGPDRRGRYEARGPSLSQRAQRDGAGTDPAQPEGRGAWGGGPGRPSRARRWVGRRLAFRALRPAGGLRIPAR